MMQDGLHIGLAAWINGQQANSSFPVYPASPIASELVDLEAVQTSSDLAKAAEFARLVNFLPRQGQVADAFNPSALLWNVHRDLLNRMEFAAQPWTSEDTAQYQTARAVLYTTDASGRPSPSDKLQLYTELMHAYDDLRNSGGSQPEIDQALADWSVKGFKNEVENALAVLIRLDARSSRTQAGLEAASLQDERLRVSGELSFAATYFSPLSALSRQTWMAAQVSFAELDHAVGDGPSSGAWKAYLANRTGQVSFDYAIIHCLRPWYTPEIYQADDWKISPDGARVSQGNGVDGELPAFVDAVYLVSVTNVTVQAPPPRKPPVLPPIRILESPGVSVAEPRLTRALVRTKALNTAVARTQLIGTTNAGIAGNRLSDGATEIQFTRLPLGAVRKLSIVDLSTRYTVAQAYLTGIRPAEPPTPPVDTSVYVAGFSCTKVPFAPNPNVNYVWS